MWYIYAMYSFNSKRIYVGMSQDVLKRLAMHNAGNVKSTKAYLPWELIYSEEVGDRKLAREKEKFYKTTQGRRIIKKHIPTY